MTTPQPTLPEDLQKRKNEADVAKAEADARSADAGARKAEVEAEKEAAAARREQVTALVPDFSTVKPSTLDVKDATPMWGSVLTFGALKKVAEAVAAEVVERRGKGGIARLLVTGDPDLASADAVYGDVTSGLKQLAEAARKLLEEVKTDIDKEMMAAVPEIGLALASALPGVLSLLSAHRTVSTAAATTSDLAAAAAVAGALRRKERAFPIVHDTFRLVPSGGVYDKVTEVAQCREELVATKLRLDLDKSSKEADLAVLKAATPRDEAKVADLTREVADTATRVGLVESVIAAIDAFTAAMRTVPQGGTRSPLATAALHYALHDGPDKFSHVLLIKAESGQAQQQLDDRPFFFKDKFSTIADISITYLLVETGGSTLVGSGTVTGTASARGNIGEAPQIDSSVVPD